MLMKKFVFGKLEFKFFNPLRVLSTILYLFLIEPKIFRATQLGHNEVSNVQYMVKSLTDSQ